MKFQEEGTWWHSSDAGKRARRIEGRNRETTKGLEIKKKKKKTPISPTERTVEDTELGN